MKNMPRILLVVALFFLGFNAFSQAPANGVIDGTVLDSANFSPIDYGLVSLHKVSDSSGVASIYTQENGFFVLENIPNGKYYIRVFYDGYKTKFIKGIDITPQKSLRKLGNIALVSESKSLEEVVISRDKQQLQVGIDKKIYNVGDDISVTGGNANDVLNNVPSVEIDQDGKLSLRGDGNVTILIDGKPSTLSGGNGKSILDGISASSIERIEVVTNPSAKYDPDGTSGIINIVLKKNIKRGLNGNVQVSAGTGNAYNGSAGLSMRNSRFNVYGTYSYDYKEGYRNNFAYLTQTQNDTVFHFDQERYGTDLSINHNLRIGMDHYLKDRHTLSWSVVGTTGVRKRTGDQDNYRYNNFGDTIGYWNRATEDPGDNQNIDASLNYKYEMKEEKGTIDWGLYQSFAQGVNSGYYNQDYLDPTIQDYAQELVSNENSQFTTANMDVVRIFNKKWRTESGLKMILRDMDVNSEFYTSDAAGNLQFDSIGYFKYNYQERIFSGYGILASTWKKWKYQAGVRLEQSYQEPRLLSTNQNYLNQYFNVFPSAHFRYEVKKGVEFSFGYSKRINRPNSENLNPFTSYADPYNLRRGNPTLSPEYIHSMDAGFEWNKDKVTVTVSAYQRYSSNVISRVKVFYADGTSAGTFANIDNSISSGGELVFQYKPLPIWRNMVSANGNYIIYKDSDTTSNFNREGFVLSFKGSSTVELMKKTLTLQANWRFSLPSVTPSGRMNPRGSVDFSADKSLKAGKWGVGLRVTDIFNTQGFRFYVDQPSAQQSVEFKWLTRRVYLNVRYRFGKTDFNDKKQTGSPSGGGGGFDF